MNGLCASQHAVDSGGAMMDRNWMIGRQDAYKYKPNSDFRVGRSFVDSLSLVVVGYCEVILKSVSVRNYCDV